MKEWRIELGDGSTRYPFGTDAVGQILYTHEGKMSAVIMTGNRSRFGKHSARHLSESQKIVAFDSYFHYAGTWVIEGDQLVHSVDFSLNPDFMGTQQRRSAKLQDPYHLTLSAREKSDGGTSRLHYLEWCRTRN